MSALVQPKTLSAIQAEIASGIVEANLLEPGALIKVAPGILSDGYLARNPIPNKGAALVGIGRISELGTHANGTQKFTLRVGVFLVPPVARRDKQAGVLADTVGALVQFIDGNRFGLSGADRPSRLNAINHYSQALDKKGTTLWQVEWTQSFHLFGADSVPVMRAVSGGVNA